MNMNKILFALTVLLATSFTLTVRAQNTKNKAMKASKTLVTYFSATGNTAKVARNIAEITGGDLFELTPAEAYTPADLNWHDKKSRSSVEMNDAQARPALKNKRNDLQGYDTVFIGYPIWWDLAPRIVNTFIESHALKGKVLIPFATSGGSGIAGSVKALKQTYPDLNWKEGKLLNNAGKVTLQKWLESIGEAK